MIKAILCDLDGVLVDATSWHYLALNRALKEICGFEINPEEHASTFNGLTTKSKNEILLKQGKITEAQGKRIWKLKQEYTVDTIKELAKPDLIKIEFHKLAASLNLKTACITNSIRLTASLMLEGTGQLPYLHLLISNQDISNPKPDPEGYLRAMELFGLSPEECLILEDSAIGLQAATSAGGKVWEIKHPSEVNAENLLIKLKLIN